MGAPYTSPLAESLAPDVLERFLRYVVVDTQARRNRERSPSSPGQLELGRILVSELAELGIEDADLDPNGYVFATLPGNRLQASVVGFIAHMDTTPDAPGAGVEPLVHRDYDGGVIELPRDGTRLDPGELPELAERVGHDIVTASGDTLLGADDKAGVAAIMAAVGHLAQDRERPRPTLRIAFTPDEEIGEGATLFDIPRFGARCAYTLDGSGLGELQDESFSAIEATVSIEGVDTHPGQATGRMVSALRLAARVVTELPSDTLTPDTTDGRQGFIHPVSLCGTAAQAEIRAILRDFEEERLSEHVERLRHVVEHVMASDSRARADVSLHRQYRNMRPYLRRDPDVIAAAEEAIRAEGIEPVRTLIRGGTDGSRLSELGLPTPNLFAGGHDWHSVREWSSVQEMAAAAATVVRLAEVWSHR